MATTTTDLTRRPGRSAAVPAVRPVLVTAAVAAIAAAVIAEVFRAAAAGAGVDLRAGMPGETGTMELAAGSFATMTLMCVVPGAGVAALLARFARRPAEIFAVLSLAVTGASLLAPILGNAPGAETRAVLCIAHVIVAAAFAVPVVRRLSAVGTARRAPTR